MDNTIETKHPGGRPTIITPEIISKLLAAFQRGLSVNTACDLAEIAPATFYVFQRENIQFAERVKAARAYGKSIASDIVLDVLNDHTTEGKKKYTSDQRINTAKWWLEKQEPEMFGKVVVNQNNNQNNFFLLNHAQISDLSKQPDITDSDPSELFEALEAAKQLDNGTEEGRAMEVHSQEIPSGNPAPQSMSEPSAAV